MNKVFIAIIIAAVVGLAGYFLFRNSETSVPSPGQTSPAPVIRETPPDEENTVVYTDAGYSPSTLIVEVGATVFFKNNSSRAMWPASAAHPTHREYPTTGGCMGSAFDACRRIEPGDSWAFKFDIAGVWKYHDHLNPGDTGAIAAE